MLRTLSRRGDLWGGALALVIGTGCVVSAQSPQTVTLTPGQDIQAIVESSPPGSRFQFEPGVYRQQTIYPKNRQKFLGQEGVILSGAAELKSWVHDSGLWRHDGLPLPLESHGECADDGHLCTFREDLFLDGAVYERVGSLDDLAGGIWYYEDGRAYLADDPTGKSVELSVTPMAFGGRAEDVVLADLIIEKYASDAQEGAIFIDHAPGWRLSNITARWNHGAGLSFGSKTRVEAGSYSHNGQIGIVASGGEGSTIQGVEIAFNNYAGYDAGWEAGGTKFWATKGLIVRDSCVHHNNGKGLWTDYDNFGTLYERNIVFMNGNDGIKHELSYDATIRSNIAANNGWDYDNWLWGSQILVQNSSNVNVIDNAVQVAGDFGNGISIVYQDRGAGDHGPWLSIGNRIYDNTVIHLGSHGQNGIATDEDDGSFWREADNRFDRNTYIVADQTVEYWTSKDRDGDWDDVEDLGMESSGERIVEQRTPLELSCETSISDRNDAG